MALNTLTEPGFPSKEGGVVISVDPLSNPVDNVFVFESGGPLGRVKRVVDGVYRAAWCVTSSGDQTSRLQAVFNHSSVKEVVFDKGDVTVSGSLNCNGKIISFVGDGKITGAGAINNAVVKANKRSHIFSTTLTVSVTPEDGVFSAMWFGANQGGSDTIALQKMADTFVANTSKFSKMYLPAGTYNIDNGIVFFRPDAANLNNPLFISFELFGEKVAYSDVQGNGYSTIINCTHNDNFAIGIMRGKGVRISNIYINGSNPISGYTVKEVLNDGTKTFAEGGSRNNQLSPYSGIVVDFAGSSSVGAGDRYPRMSSYYVVQGSGGSTDVEIESVKIRYFVCGTIISPSSSTNNGECIIFKKCWFDYCHSAIATCDSQNRTVRVYDFRCWGGTKFVFDTTSFGSQLGALPEVEGTNIAGGVRYLFSDSAFGTATGSFKNVFAELLYSLGGCFSGNNGSVSFVNSIIKFAGAGGGYELRAPAVWYRGATVSFTGCYLVSYSGKTGAPVMDVISASFINCNIPAPVFTTIGRGMDDFQYENVSFTGFSPVSKDATIIRDSSNSHFDYRVVAGKPKVFEAPPYNSDYLVREAKGGSVFNLAFGINATPVINESNGSYTIDVTGANIGKVKIGDFVFVYGNQNEYGTGLTRFSSAGTVVSISGSVVTVDGTPLNLLGAKDFYFYHLYNMRLAWLGDIANGSSTITNVVSEYVDNIPMPVGSLIVHPLFPTGTYVQSSTAATITVSNPASGSSLRQAFSSWDYKAELKSVSPFELITKSIYKKGDEVINNFKNSLYNNVRKWVCSADGITNVAGKEPIWEEVPLAAAVGTSDPVLFTGTLLLPLPVPVYLTWNTLSGKHESYAPNGIRKKTSEADGWDGVPNVSVSNQSLSSGERLVFKIDSNLSSAYIVGLSTSQTATDILSSGLPFQIYSGYNLTAFASAREGVGAVGSQEAQTANKYFSIKYQGAQILYQYSTDGLAWTTFHTSAGTPSGSYYVQFQSYSSGSGPVEIYKIIF